MIGEHSSERCRRGTISQRLVSRKLSHLHKTPKYIQVLKVCVFDDVAYITQQASFPWTYKTYIRQCGSVRRLQVAWHRETENKQLLRP